MKTQVIGKDPDAGKDLWQKEERAAEDEMFRQQYRLTGHESEQTRGDSEGQRSRVFCIPWGCKELNRT